MKVGAIFYFSEYFIGIQLAGLLNNYYDDRIIRICYPIIKVRYNFFKNIRCPLSLLSGVWIPWLFVYLSLLDVCLNWWYRVIPDDVVCRESKIRGVYVFLNEQFVPYGAVPRLQYLESLMPAECGSWQADWMMMLHSCSCLLCLWFAEISDDYLELYL